MIQEDHPYDNGYWARYHGKPRPDGDEEREGWDACDQELSMEAWIASGKEPSDFMEAWTAAKSQPEGGE